MDFLPQVMENFSVLTNYINGTQPQPPLLGGGAAVCPAHDHLV